MMRFIRWTLIVLVAPIFLILAPYVGGLYYMTTGTHPVEQAWLDKAIDHLKMLKTRTSDPDLKNVLDYCIGRYNKIGAWDVMVMPLPSFPGDHTLGANLPTCPGITLDYETLNMPLRDGALVLVHESLHDWWPCFGHSQVTPRIDKLYEIERLYDSVERMIENLPPSPPSGPTPQ